MQNAIEMIEISDVQELRTNAGQGRDQAILSMALKAAGSFDVLFLHADGGGDPSSARSTRIDPAVKRIHDETRLEGSRICPVVPVRETEAWALADGDALRMAFGTGLADPDLGVPQHVRLVEQVTDPKRALRDPLEQVVGSRASRKVGAASFLPKIAETLDFAVLQDVPSFARLISDLNAVLMGLGFYR